MALPDGSPEAVKRAATAWGLVYWPEEGAIAHTSRTAIIGRDGKLLAMVEGSSYRTDQLVESGPPLFAGHQMKLTSFFCSRWSCSAQTQPPSRRPTHACRLPARRSVAAGETAEGQGTVHFPITTKSPEAQKFFDQGVAQMHSFWAREAERSFLQAAHSTPKRRCRTGESRWLRRAISPRFQLAGDPTNRPVMPRVQDAVRKALELSSVPGKATDLEKLYIAAIAARRDEKAKDQDEAFVRALRALVAKYPDEVEAKIDLALMIMRGFHAARQEAELSDIDGSRRDPAPAAEGCARSSGSAPLRHSRLRRLRLREGCLAELQTLRRTGAEHPARAAHARAYLGADGPLG